MSASAAAGRFCGSLMSRSWKPDGNATDAWPARSREAIDGRRPNWPGLPEQGELVSQGPKHSGQRLLSRSSTRKGMTRSAKGTVEDPGRNVKQAWGLLERNLAYKCASLRRTRPTQARPAIPVGDADSRLRTQGQRASRILASGIGATGRGGAFSNDPSNGWREYIVRCASCYIIPNSSIVFQESP